MADKVPNSYKDPYWTDLATSTEAKLGLPDGLLAAIVTKGERSNHDAVSEAGARTVFQITPSTRKLAIDKYGIDPYLSPENAAEVAGNLLKDSLQRNKGSVPAAVAEYHGGTDRANWGPRTRSYVARVVNDASQIQQGGQPAGGSTFQRALAAQQPSASTNSIASVYDAYKSGKMTPQEASEFEADVKSGLVMLPRGAVLNGQTAKAPTDKPEPVVLPKQVTDAYVSGQMSEKERADLEADMKAGLVKLPPTTSSQIPTDDPNWKPPTEQGIIQRTPEPTLGQKLIGAGEAGLTTVTGATGGTAGMIGGTVKGITQSILDGSFGTQQAANMVEQQAMKGAQALTYMPRTEAGREYAQNVGDVMSQAIPVMPLTAEMGMLSQTVKNAAPAISATARTGAAATAAKAGQVLDAVKPPVAAAVDAVKSAPGRVAEAVGIKSPEVAAPTPGTGGSVATMRRIAGEELPVPVELTKGQATRDFGQLRFEQEAAKNPELGTPIRERMQQQNQAVRQSFDAWIDETGAQAPDSRGVGVAVDKALTAKAARDKAEIRVAYKEAEKAGEMQAPVPTQEVVKVLNESQSAESTAPVLSAARKELVRLGGAVEDANGQLVAAESPTAPVKVGKLEPIDTALAKAKNLAYRKSLDDYGNQARLKNVFPVVDEGKVPYDVFTDRRNLGDTAYSVPIGKISITQDEVGLSHLGEMIKSVAKDGKIQEPITAIYSSKSGSYVVLDGHTRLVAAKLLGMDEVPARFVKGYEPTSELPAAMPTSTTQGGMSLANMEQLRKFVNKVTGNDPTNIKFAGDLKRAIDTSTEGVGGELYAKARGLRAKYADQYENRAVISDLLSNKRGMSDRRVALEDVADRIIFRGSLDDMRFARKVLQTGGEEGKQAWREVQGSALRYIRDEATKGVARDAAGNEVISASGLDRAIKRLDSDGKLDYLFGKRGAEKLRAVNDLSKVMFTTPPGSVNTSNTASVILAAMDMAMSSSAGVPLPVMSGLRLLVKNIKDRKLRTRISDALGQGSAF